jgi:signal-transduction protein with cAMP-binding, CBS, and nucleotidyltransferase domain
LLPIFVVHLPDKNHSGRPQLFKLHTELTLSFLILSRSCPADYLKKIIVKGLSSATTPVSKIMTAADQLAVLTPEHSVLEAMDLMLRYNVRHVPVVSK